MEKLQFTGYVVRLREFGLYRYYFRFESGHGPSFPPSKGFYCLMDDTGKSEYCLYHKLGCVCHYWDFRIELVNANHVLWLLRELNKEENIYKPVYLIQSFIEAYNQTYLKDVSEC